MQVKIRGYRVELSEVESVIIRCCSQVANAVVNLWKGSGSEGPEELLIGYIILKEGIYSFNASAAKEELKVHLPAYMIPSFFQVIQEIPVLPSGKANRKILPNPTLQSGKCICYLYCKYLYPHTYYCFNVNLQRMEKKTSRLTTVLV
jgi:acyl-coenzyme A synthetase/AMP-(fatty) acid ligase